MVTYDLIGDAYDLVYPDTAERVPFVKHILEKFGKQTVLELGIGTGLFAIPLHEAGFDIEGLEISEVMIGVVGQRAPGLKVHKGDMRDYTINRRYDAILALSSVLVFVANEQEINNACNVVTIIWSRKGFSCWSYPITQLRLTRVTIARKYITAKIKAPLS